MRTSDAGEMRTSDRGLLAILHHEAVVLTRYRDSKGIWTIGVGETHAALQGTPFDPLKFIGELTLEQAFHLFRQALTRYEDRVLRSTQRVCNQHEFDAMVSFDWNTGHIHECTWMDLWNASAPREEIAHAFMQWQHPKEIISRRKQELHLLLDGEYPPLDVSLYTADTTGKVNWHSGRRLHADRALALLEAVGQDITA